ncbi:MAG: threonylcarbamoyl-AMP synthase [Bacteroidia bacterium]|nr:threonylcarbamoyl-AMP synthase [Bacteroidia bacterium]
MLLKIHPDNPNPREMKQVVECLSDGGLVIYPTDTVYGMGCDIFKQKSIERIARIKGINPEKANFSIICYDLSHLSDFTKPIDNRIYKVMRKALPGPFTFILEANSNIPKIFKARKKTIGIRIPNNKIALQLVQQLGNPIVSTSIHDDDEIMDYTTDPEQIHEKYKNTIDIVIDGGYGHTIASTVIDCSNNNFTVVRAGLGRLEEFM